MNKFSILYVFALITYKRVVDFEKLKVFFNFSRIFAQFFEIEQKRVDLLIKKEFRK